MPARKDFSQVALDVVRQATHEQPKSVPPAPPPQKQTAPTVNKGAAKTIKSKKPA